MIHPVPGGERDVKAHPFVKIPYEAEEGISAGLKWPRGTSSVTVTSFRSNRSLQVSKECVSISNEICKLKVLAEYGAGEKKKAIFVSK